MQLFTFPSPSFNNAELNAPGSNYAQQYGKDTTKLIMEIIRKTIFDAVPADYYDLAILNMQNAKFVSGDEHIYFEKSIQRQGILTTVLSGNIAAGSVQIIPITNIDDAGVDYIVQNTTTQVRGTITSVNTTLGTMTVQAYSGQTLPQLNSGSQYTYILSTSVDGDGTSNITQSQRLDNLIERYNYVQQFARRTDYGRMEKFKYDKIGTTDYVTENKKELINQYRMDLSNAMWNGERGEVTLSNGTKVKTMGGHYPTMLAAGSVQISTTISNLPDAVMQAHYLSRYGTGNYVRMLYAVPEMIHNIAVALKQPLIRWQPKNDTAADLGLEYMSFGDGKLVFVPMQRWEQKSNCFSADWEKRIILLDQQNIIPVLAWGERTGYIGDRSQNPYTFNNYSTEYIEGTMSVEHNNPLAGAIIDVM
jgi:hypothetical protein